MAADKNSSAGSPTNAGGSGAFAGGGDLPASLLKRVAEAANGVRNGKQTWFVVKRDPPHNLTKHDSDTDAEEKLKKAGAGFVKVGPFRTPKDPTHNPAVEWIKVKLEGREPRTFKPEKTDALFFSASALDKFLYPYYTALHGPEKAAEIRKKHTNPQNPAAFVCHDPLSDECSNGDGNDG